MDKFVIQYDVQRIAIRYYYTEIARFIQADPIVPKAGSSQALNRYSYCVNNPLKYVDPSGNIMMNFSDSYGGWSSGWSMPAISGGYFNSASIFPASFFTSSGLSFPNVSSYIMPSFFSSSSVYTSSFYSGTSYYSLTGSKGLSSSLFNISMPSLTFNMSNIHSLTNPGWYDDIIPSSCYLSGVHNLFWMSNPGYNYWSAFKGAPWAYITDVGKHFWGIMTAPSDYYNIFHEAGASPFYASVSAANMSLGKVFGYATLSEGIQGVHVKTVRETGGWERAGQIGFGLLATTSTVIGGAGSLDAAASSVGPTTVSHWGSQGLNPGWVMKGKASWGTYIRSGKWDIGPWNKFAPYSSGQTFPGVAGESLSYPTGSEAWKGLLGQRIYKP